LKAEDIAPERPLDQDRDGKPERCLKDRHAGSARVMTAHFRKLRMMLIS